MFEFITFVGIDCFVFLEQLRPEYRSEWRGKKERNKLENKEVSE